MAGHEKYFKSVVGGVASGMVDYALILILVNARQDPTNMTVNHINLASSLGIPIVVVFTKIDGCPKVKLQALFQTSKTTEDLSLSHSESLREEMGNFESFNSGREGPTSS